MSDRYQSFANSPPGRLLTKRLGLPKPLELRRYKPGQPVLAGPALLGGAPGGRLAGEAAAVLRAVDADVRLAEGEHLREAGREAGVRTSAWSAEADAEPCAAGQAGRFGPGRASFAALVLDASGIADAPGLREAYSFFHPVVRRIEQSGRLVVLGRPPEDCETPRQAVAQRALEGFVRAAAKEVGKGATANLVYMAPGAEGGLEATLRFLLSARSAYVSGQVVRIAASEAGPTADWDRPLDGKVALVTGASRGIGESIAETLARDGAHVVCLDVPAQGEDLVGVANRIEGSTLQLDIADGRAPAALAEHLRSRHGGVDVVVHNAGVTRDKTLGRMSEDQWDAVIAINLDSQVRINEKLLDEGLLRPGGRIVGVSSVSGIAGNRGQVNYATSKAGVIGLVDALAPRLAGLPATINAVAPGFIETRMTAAMPFATREAGRRLNSLSQGGRPADVAETVAWLAAPGSAGVNGNVVRVCGQALLGA